MRNNRLCNIGDAQVRFGGHWPTPWLLVIDRLSFIGSSYTFEFGELMTNGFNFFLSIFQLLSHLTAFHVIGIHGSSCVRMSLPQRLQLGHELQITLASRAQRPQRDSPQPYSSSILESSERIRELSLGPGCYSLKVLKLDILHPNLEHPRTYEVKVACA